MQSAPDMLQPVHLMFPRGFDWQARGILPAQGLIEGGKNSTCNSLFSNSLLHFSLAFLPLDFHSVHGKSKQNRTESLKGIRFVCV